MCSVSEASGERLVVDVHRSVLLIHSFDLVQDMCQ
jgi:hypothetical protein